MATTFIKTGNCPKKSLPGAGEAAEVLNEALCGAKNVLATLRWLSGSERFQTTAKAATHQLIYLMEGKGVITLDGKDYPVRKGAGVYTGPNETTTVRPDGQGTVKLFHLVVPEVDD
jgi:mannose-6-phosphate isomerase-like protein (cupin superfamily)